ncbi:RNA-binding motif protein, X-linked 2 [Araneus ventricosus]|uniref:RNA-binding motif protein, X-linked 2 n=1 Tax=Araneus ventricosus TaxID=182803 RepID=A0A4Y2SKT5_ARAVE|nr:RNA-binding motif protein, X-linked 2 [Araneus ventricosus]
MGSYEILNIPSGFLQKDVTEWNVKNINKLNEIELSKGTVNKKSWHDLYKDSAWIFIGGLAYGLTEGDILCVFSQYGEIVNLNLVRDKKTGKTKGFCFLCYANQKSTILAVDNLNGIKLCTRTIRVDHVANYKPPKDNEQDDEITKMLKSEGCAPKPIKAEISPDEAVHKKKHKKHKKEKKKHKKRKREDPDEEFSLSKVKKEKIDEGYSKYELPEKSKSTSRKDESTESKSSDDSSESDSTRISRKEKQESHKPDRNHQNTDEKFGRLDKSRTNKHHLENSKRKPREERSGSSSESENHSKRKSPHVSDCTNGLLSEGTDLKYQKYKGRNSSSDEYSGRHKIDHRNRRSKDHDVRSSSSRHHRDDSSSGSERDTYLKESIRTTSKDREKHRRDSLERERNSYKDRRQQDPHCSYRDHRSRESSHKTDHRHNERRDYSEKYEHFHKNRDSKTEYGKHRSERKER